MVKRSDEAVIAHFEEEELQTVEKSRDNHLYRYQNRDWCGHIRTSKFKNKQTNNRKDKGILMESPMILLRALVHSSLPLINQPTSK